MRRLHAGVKRVALVAGVVEPDRAARLHCVSGNAADDEIQLDDMGGRRERVVHRCPVAEGEIEAFIIGHFIPDPRRARIERVAGIGRRRQDFILDIDSFSGVEGLVEAFGDDDCDRNPDHVDGVVRQNGKRRFDHGLTIVLAPLDAARHMAQPIGIGVSASQYRQDAGHVGGSDNIDGRYSGCRVGRSHNRHMRLANDLAVVGVAAQSCQQPAVFDSRHRLADSVLTHKISLRRGPAMARPRLVVLIQHKLRIRRHREWPLVRA